jgi:hypothetical protein
MKSNALPQQAIDSILLLLVGSFVVEKICAKPLQEDSVLAWMVY